MVYRKLWGIEEKSVPVETTAGEGKREYSREKGKERERKGKNLAQYDVSVNIVSVPRREDR